MKFHIGFVEFIFSVTLLYIRSGYLLKRVHWFNSSGIWLGNWLLYFRYLWFQKSTKVLNNSSKLKLNTSIDYSDENVYYILQGKRTTLNPNGLSKAFKNLYFICDCFIPFHKLSTRKSKSCFVYFKYSFSDWFMSRFYFFVLVSCFSSDKLYNFFARVQ